MNESLPSIKRQSMQSSVIEQTSLRNAHEESDDMNQRMQRYKNNQKEQSMKAVEHSLQKRHFREQTQRNSLDQENQYLQSVREDEERFKKFNKERNQKLAATMKITYERQHRMQQLRLGID